MCVCVCVCVLCVCVCVCVFVRMCVCVGRGEKNSLKNIWAYIISLKFEDKTETALMFSGLISQPDNV